MEIGWDKNSVSEPEVMDRVEDFCKAQPTKNLHLICKNELEIPFPKLSAASQQTAQKIKKKITCENLICNHKLDIIQVDSLSSK